MNSDKKGGEGQGIRGGGRRLTVGIEELEWGARENFESIEESEG